jgi:plasmid stabilization system protein ParE
MTYFAREASEEMALKWQDAAVRGATRIIKNPGCGHLRRDLRPAGVRALSIPPFRKHLIFYHWVAAENKIEFYRVRHGAMNLPALFR